MNNITHQNQMNIFYYSKFSVMCTDLLKMMDSYNILGQFILKCIDDMPTPPAGLERVPTLIIGGINKIYVAKDAVMWFNSMRSVFIQQNADMQNKKIMYNIIKNNMQTQGGPNGYTEGEYSGTSDTFAYLDLDIAQPKTFCEYGTDGTVIYTPPKEDANDKIRISEQERGSRELEQMRIQQDNDYMSTMKNQHVEAVMNNERERLMKNRLGI